MHRDSNESARTRDGRTCRASLRPRERLERELFSVARLADARGRAARVLAMPRLAACVLQLRTIRERLRRARRLGHVLHEIDDLVAEAIRMSRIVAMRGEPIEELLE